MSYQLLVTGSREFVDYDAVDRHLMQIVLGRGRPARIIHGGAPGADSLASRFAYERKIDLSIFGAQWGTHAGRAGPIRNQVMLDVLHPGDSVAAFPTAQSRGTWHMVRIARERGDLDIRVVGR